MRVKKNHLGYYKEIVLEEIWDAARVCPNGHVLTAHLIQESDPGMYCTECGERGIENCPNCSARIRGLPYKLFGSFKPKNYCYECGKPYPWVNKISIINNNTVRARLTNKTSLVYWFYFLRDKSIKIGHRIIHRLNYQRIQKVDLASNT